MPKPFDATLKMLLEEAPAVWPGFFGLPSGAIRVVDADTSTVSGGADKVLRVSGSPDWLLHIDFQSGPDRSLPRRLHLDNALLEDRHSLAVQSAVVLLAPKANLRGINGVYECRFQGQVYRTFHYRVLRVWEMPVDSLLESGVSLLPLAPISNVPREQLPVVIARMKERLGTRPNPETGRLWTATFLLLGLRYSKILAKQLLEGVSAMKESVTYQAIVEEGLSEGLLKEARKFFLRLAKNQLGDPPADVLNAINATTSVDQLEEAGVHLAQMNNWEDVLQQLAPRPKRQRKRSS